MTVNILDLARTVSLLTMPNLILELVGEAFFEDSVVKLRSFFYRKKHICVYVWCARVTFG